ISIANVRPETLTEIQKFIFLIQKLIAEKAHAVSQRLQKGKKYYFQETFSESGLEMYQSRQLVKVPLIQQLDAEKNAEKSRQIINELFEKTRDQYYQLAEK
ncbi:397_t:CDS:2, partial [Gigaspora rosea]